MSSFTQTMDMTYSQIAQEVRLKVLALIYQAQSSHIGSNLSCIDILTVLYDKAKIDTEDWENRDRIILSKGWAAASLYTFLQRKGLITEDQLNSFNAPGSPFIGLAEPVAPGIEAAGGAMGHGLPMGVGMALAAKLSGRWKTYVVMSDGEMDCGTTWESALLASHHQLNNLVIFIDYNKWQAMGRTCQILNVEPLVSKWTSFGWRVVEIDGHNFEQLESVFTEDIPGSDKPICVICHTVKGKGVSFMEDKLEWHYKNIDEKSYNLAVQEISCNHHYTRHIHGLWKQCNKCGQYINLEQGGGHNINA